MLDSKSVQPGIIYGLVDTSTTQLRYVGQTVRPLYARFAEHFRGCGTNPCLDEWFANNEMDAIVLERSPKNRNKAERYWIKKALEEGALLFNRNAGGGGPPSGIPRTAKTRAKISASNMGHPPTFTGTHTPKARVKMSAAQMGNKKGLGHSYVHSDEHRAKNSAWHKACHHERDDKGRFI